MKLLERVLFCGLTLTASSGSALGQQATCNVEPFQGATAPQGAVARMQVTRSAGACSIINYGLPAQRGNPAATGSITKQPAHGRAVFVAPQAQYTPEPGYVGEDEFEYTAFARGRQDQQVRLRVRVKVSVVAP